MHIIRARTARRICPDNHRLQVLDNNLFTYTPASATGTAAATNTIQTKRWKREQRGRGSSSSRHSRDAISLDGMSTINHHQQTTPVSLSLLGGKSYLTQVWWWECASRTRVLGGGRTRHANVQRAVFRLRVIGQQVVDLFLLTSSSSSSLLRHQTGGCADVCVSKTTKRYNSNNNNNIGQQQRCRAYIHARSKDEWTLSCLQS